MDMLARRLSAVDAQTYWMSAKIPNDQFLLYGFAGVPSELERALHEIRERARGCAELTLRRAGAQRADISGVGGRRGQRGSIRGARPRRPEVAWLSGRRCQVGREPTRRTRDVMAAARLHSGRGIAQCRYGHRCGAAGHACAGRRHSGVGAGGLAVRPPWNGADGEGASTVSRRGTAMAQHPGRPYPSAAGPRHRGRTGTPTGGFTSRAAQQHAARLVRVPSAR